MSSVGAVSHSGTGAATFPRGLVGHCRPQPSAVDVLEPQATGSAGLVLTGSWPSGLSGRFGRCFCSKKRIQELKYEVSDLRGIKWSYGNAGDKGVTQVLIWGQAGRLLQEFLLLEAEE